MWKLYIITWTSINCGEPEGGHGTCFAQRKISVTAPTTCPFGEWYVWTSDPYLDRPFSVFGFWASLEGYKILVGIAIGGEGESGSWRGSCDGPRSMTWHGKEPNVVVFKPST